MSRVKFPVLETERLRLRRFAARDVDGVHAAFGSARAMRFWSSPPFKTRAESERLVRIMAKASQPQWWQPWAIARRRDDRCIGMINYHHREAANRRLELGWILAPRHQGRGYAREATAAVIRYCFDRLGTHRIEAMIVPENTASIRLADALGFRLEGGPIRDRWRAGDVYRSVLMYGLLAGEET
ncbi:MAG: GNAT family N-acetyltransferase [Reyranellaceae bacterium]